MPDKQPLNSKHSKVDRSKADLILRDSDKQRGSKFIENWKVKYISFRNYIKGYFERFRFVVKISCFKTVKDFRFWFQKCCFNIVKSVGFWYRKCCFKAVESVGFWYRKCCFKAMESVGFWYRKCCFKTVNCNFERLDSVISFLRAL